MRLEILGPNDSELWNNIVDNSINGTLYHCWTWLKIAEKNSGSKLFPLVLFDEKDNKPFGAIPLFYMQKLGLKLVFSPPPGTSITLGPIFLNNGYKQHKFEQSFQNFHTEVENFIHKLHPNYTFILTSPGLLDIRPYSWTHYDVTPFYTYLLDLKPGKEIVWKNMSQSLKTNIKSALKRGISVVESHDTKDIDIVYNSLKERYIQQRIRLPLKAEYLHDLYRQLGHSGIKLYLALYQGEIVGSDICVIHKDTFISWQGGYRNGNNNLEANELLRWETINRAIGDGFRWFEIEGANSQHLCDFKSRFCPNISMYFMLKKTDLVGYLAEKAYFWIYNPS